MFSFLSRWSTIIGMGYCMPKKDSGQPVTLSVSPQLAAFIDRYLSVLESNVATQAKVDALTTRLINARKGIQTQIDKGK